MTYENTDPEGAQERLTKGEGWIYLDVRTVEEFSVARPPGAYNIPFALRDPVSGMVPNPRFLEVVRGSFDKDTKLLVGCAAGGRSLRACQLLAGAGYSTLLNVSGGFSGAPGPGGTIAEEGWQGKGLPTETGDPGDRGYANLAD